MRHQVVSHGWQMQALATMDVINQLEDMLDAYDKGARTRNEFISEKKVAIRKTVVPVSVPRVQGAPPNFTMKTAYSMRVISLCAIWQGQSGEQQCCLPLVYKKGENED